MLRPAIDFQVNPSDETIRLGPLAVRFLVTGQRWLFLLCGCGLGIALPLAFVLWLAHGGSVTMPGLTAMALARLAGDLSLRHAFLKAGLFDPII